MRMHLIWPPSTEDDRDPGDWQTWCGREHRTVAASSSRIWTTCRVCERAYDAAVADALASVSPDTGTAPETEGSECGRALGAEGATDAA